MPSVTSLDKDLRNMRLSKYTPEAAADIRDWIEEALEEKLPSEDVLGALKDGVALCKLVNLVIPPPGAKYKVSSMPFVQMENISHFLRAVQSPPLELPDHDMFLTVDLYESKDPAQVLQCLGAFSRKANALNPSRFKRTIGPKSRTAMTPQGTGTGNTPQVSAGASIATRGRGLSNASQDTASTSTGARSAANHSSADGSENPRDAAPKDVRPSPRGGVSSWSRKTDEGNTVPAWNIMQYGYMGGASQGNQGISFGSRRQITGAPPKVPRIAEKERKRRKEEAEKERRLAEEAEAERRRQLEREEEEERERAAEGERWREETRKQRELDKLAALEEKRKWEEEERRWKEAEELRLTEQRELEARLEADRQKARAKSDTRLEGQFLSQYLAEQQKSQPLGSNNSGEDPSWSKHQDRVRELERELELARERESRYLAERQQRMSSSSDRSEPEVRTYNTTSSRELNGHSAAQSTSQPHQDDYSHKDDETILQESERGYLQNEWSKYQLDEGTTPQRQAPTPGPTKARPLPDPEAASKPGSTPTTSAASPRPLPDPTTYISSAVNNLPSRPLPVPQPSTRPTRPSPDSTPFHTPETTPRKASQPPTKPKPSGGGSSGLLSKSLLEREMELERQRQQEWEQAQKVTREAAQRGVGKGLKEGTVGEGGAWDVNQYGWTGGDNQNRGGIAFGARRQIIGPRPKP